MSPNLHYNLMFGFANVLTKLNPIIEQMLLRLGGLG